MDSPGERRHGTRRRGIHRCEAGHCARWYYCRTQRMPLRAVPKPAACMQLPRTPRKHACSHHRNSRRGRDTPCRIAGADSRHYARGLFLVRAALRSADLTGRLARRLRRVAGRWNLEPPSPIDLDGADGRQRPCKSFNWRKLVTKCPAVVGGRRDHRIRLGARRHAVGRFRPRKPHDLDPPAALGAAAGGQHSASRIQYSKRRVELHARAHRASCSLPESHGPERSPAADR